MSRAALAAPDAFKGTYAAAEVAAAMARGLRGAGVEAEELPVADGGEGTMAALVTALGGRLLRAEVTDALGRPVEAEFALLDDARGVVEVASASGLALLDDDERDAWAASSYGTGELIAAAVEAGASKVLVGAGGSAMTDGGEGALRALDERGVEVEMLVICDAETPFERAPRVFGPQKGADPETVERLERRLASLAAAAPRDPRGVPLTGASGGLAGGLWAHRGAELVLGSRYVLDALDFERRLAGASLVLTGEGRLDRTTFEGKALAEVAARCRAAGVACHAIVGSDGLASGDAGKLGLASVSEASSLEEIERAAGRLGSAVAAGGG